MNNVKAIFLISLFAASLYASEYIPQRVSSDYIQLVGFKSRSQVLRFIKECRTHLPGEDPLEIAKSYYELGVDPKDITYIIEKKISPSEYREWKEIKISDPDIIKYIKTNKIPKSTILSYTQLGIGQYDFQNLVKDKIDPRTAKAFLDVGASSRDIKDYIQSGLTPLILKPYLKEGISGASSIQELRKKIKTDYKGETITSLIKRYKTISDKVDNYDIKKFILVNIGPDKIKSFVKADITDYREIKELLKKGVTAKDINELKTLGITNPKILYEFLRNHPIDKEKIVFIRKKGIDDSYIPSLIKSKISIEDYLQYHNSGLKGANLYQLFKKAGISPKELKEFQDYAKANLYQSKREYENRQDELNYFFLRVKESGLTQRLKKLMEIGLKEYDTLRHFTEKKDPINFKILKELHSLGVTKFYVLEEYMNHLETGKISINQLRDYLSVANGKDINDIVIKLIEQKKSPQDLKKYLDLGLHQYQIKDLLDLPFDKVKEAVEKGISPKEIKSAIESGYPIGETPSLPKTCESNEATDQAYCRFLSLDIISKYSDLFSRTCLSSQETLKSSGVQIPQCPKDGNFRGLDNTHPSAGVFVAYTGDNQRMIEELYMSLPKDKSGRPLSKLNILVPMTGDGSKTSAFIEKLQKSGIAKHINLVPVHPLSIESRWVQDKLEFGTMKGKPALYLHNHQHESDHDIDTMLACQIGKMCNLPVVNSRKEVRPYEDTHLSGGNWEVLPGGNFITGGFGTSSEDKTRVPFEDQGYVSRPHLEQIETIKGKGNKVTLIDTDFLAVKHVDEIFNVVKTKDKAPCNFAILRASPKLALDLLNKHKKKKSSKQDIQNCKQLQAEKVNERFQDDKKVTIDNEIEESDCFGVSGYTASSFLEEEDLVNFNKKVETTMIANEKKVISSIKSNSACKRPKVIPVPVAFDINGLAINPDSINGVSQAKRKGSHLIAPKSFYPPFDDYFTKSMQEIGVTTSLIEDLEYHIKMGEVHCGTNSVLACKPR